jgi:hypothetical protein
MDNMLLFRRLADRLEHLVVDVRDPFTILVDGESVFDHFEEVFDELDAVLAIYRGQSLPVPRIHIRAARMWLCSSNEKGPARFDTVPDEVLESFCDGLPRAHLLLDFTDIFFVRQ